MGKWCLHASSFIFYQIIIKVAGYQDRHKSLVEFDFEPNQNTHFGVTCPWVTKISHFWTWISLKPVGQSWSNFVCSSIGVGERLHKVFWADWITQVSDGCPLGYLLAHLSQRLTGPPSSSVVISIFKHVFWSHHADWSQISYRYGSEEQKFIPVLVIRTKMAFMPIYGKNF